MCLYCPCIWVDGPKGKHANLQVPASSKKAVQFSGLPFCRAFIIVMNFRSESLNSVMDFCVSFDVEFLGRTFTLQERTEKKKKTSNMQDKIHIESTYAMKKGVAKSMLGRQGRQFFFATDNLQCFGGPTSPHKIQKHKNNAAFTLTFWKSSSGLLPGSLWHYDSGTQQQFFRKTCSDELFLVKALFSAYLLNVLLRVPQKEVCKRSLFTFFHFWSLLVTFSDASIARVT